MPMFVIERKIPGSGQMTPEELKGIARKSCDVAAQLDGYNWVHSYVADDTWYCIHEVPSADVIREHARRGGFPADRVAEVHSIVNSRTGRE